MEVTWVHTQTRNSLFEWAIILNSNKRKVRPIYIQDIGIFTISEDLINSELDFMNCIYSAKEEYKLFNKESKEYNSVK